MPALARDLVAHSEGMPLSEDVALCCAPPGTGALGLGAEASDATVRARPRGAPGHLRGAPDPRPCLAAGRLDGRVARLRPWRGRPRLSFGRMARSAVARSAPLTPRSCQAAAGAQAATGARGRFSEFCHLEIGRTVLSDCLARFR